MRKGLYTLPIPTVLDTGHVKYLPFGHPRRRAKPT